MESHDLLFSNWCLRIVEFGRKEMRTKNKAWASGDSGSESSFVTGHRRVFGGTCSGVCAPSRWVPQPASCCCVVLSGWKETINTNELQNGLGSLADLLFFCLRRMEMISLVLWYWTLQKFWTFNHWLRYLAAWQPEKLSSVKQLYKLCPRDFWMSRNLSSSKEDEESLLNHSAHGTSQICAPALQKGVVRGRFLYILSRYRILNENIFTLWHKPCY